MMRFASFLALRAATTVFFLLTAAYGVVSYSPFAFDMFIRPQLLPWVNDFVAWHHAWYLGAYAASVASLWRDGDSGKLTSTCRWGVGHHSHVRGEASDLGRPTVGQVPWFC